MLNVHPLSPDLRLDSPHLPIGRYRFLFDAPQELVLPAFQGSMWRGAFGHALKQVVCVTHLKDCAACLLFRNCAYPYIFETPPPADARKMRRYAAAPHPFAFAPASVGEPCERNGLCQLDLSLFGHANRYLPYVIYALQRAGEEGVGPKRQALRLVQVRQASVANPEWHGIYVPEGVLEQKQVDSPALPPVPTSMQIRFVTPLRLKRQEALVKCRELRFADFFSALLRRISMLTYFHTDTPLETDFKGLSEAARPVTLERPDLRWYDWTRYSSRQKTTMEMGGILGSVRLHGEAIAPFWPYLWLGQWAHAGKGASMGLGRYRIEFPTSLQNPNSHLD